LNAEATKRRVFARVANKPFIETETVEILPGEQVAPVGTVVVSEELAATLRIEAEVVPITTALIGMVTLEKPDTASLTAHDSVEVEIKMPTLELNQPVPMTIEAELPETWESSRPLPTAADLGATEYALANENLCLWFLRTSPGDVHSMEYSKWVENLVTGSDTEPVGIAAELFATGGPIEPNETYLVGEQVSDHVLPRNPSQVRPQQMIANLLRNSGEKQVQSVQPHYPPAMEGEPAQDEDLPEKYFEFVPTHKPLFTRSIGRGNRIIKEPPVWEPQNTQFVVNESKKLTEYEQAAEAGMSIHAFRYINKELALLRGLIESK
jgi:hypothetical protein